MSSPKKELVWLHLSDLHAGQAGSGTLWPTHREAALADMKKMTARVGKPDVIFFTGDLAFSGDPNQYDAVDTVLDDVRNATGSDPCIIPVPGNHDVAQPKKGSTLSVALRNYWDSELRSSVLDGDPDNIRQINALFAGYDAWVQRTARPTWDTHAATVTPGLLTGDYRLSLHFEGLHLGVLALNSAFLQVCSGDFRGQLAIEPEQAGVDLPRWAEGHDLALVMMHHPAKEWLRPSAYTKFRRDINPAGRFDACLCGHMHVPISVEENELGRKRLNLQASSLFGLEKYRQETLEDRACGYSWGVVESSGDNRAIRLWPRVLSHVADTPVVSAAPTVEDGYPYALKKRELGSMRISPIVGSPSAKWKQIGHDALTRNTEAAEASYTSGDYTGADSAFSDLLASIEELDPTGVAELESARARVLLGSALTRLSLQQPDSALETLAQIEPDILPQQSKFTYAKICVNSGLVKNAEDILEALEEDEATAIRQLVLIQKGEVPSEEIKDKSVRLASSYALVHEGRLVEAAKLVMEYVHESADNMRVRAQACDILIRCLEGTIIPTASTKVPIEAASRATLVQYLGDCLLEDDPVFSKTTGPLTLWAWRARYAYLSRDLERLIEAHTELEALGLAPEPAEASSRSAAENAAFEVENLRVAGDIEEAETALSKSLNAYPSFMPLLCEAAKIALARGDAEAAVESSRRAHREFPGLGQKRLLATALLTATQSEELWSRREEFEFNKDAELLLLIAQAAARVSPDEAPSAWRAAIAAQDSGWARIGLATSLYVLGSESEAADEAWSAFEPLSGRELATQALLRCAALLDAVHTNEDPRRLIAIAQAVFQRYEEDQDSEAGAAYLSYYLRLGPLKELPAPNYEDLARIGSVQSFPADDLVPYFQRQRALDEGYGEAHRQRLIPTELYCTLRQQPEALFVENAMRQRAEFSTPLNVGVSSFAPDGKKILTGAIELLLLEHLGLLDALESVLGSEGSILIFRDVHERILAAPSQLHLRQQPEELLRLRELRTRYYKNEGLELGTTESVAPADTEKEWCASQGLRLIQAHSNSEESSFTNLVHSLKEVGAIGQSQAKRLSLGLPTANGISVELQGAELALTADVLGRIAEANAINAVVATVGRVVLTPHAGVQIDGSIEALESIVQATRRATNLRRWVASGLKHKRITMIPRPVVDLPDVPNMPAVRDWVQNTLCWREALKLHPDLHLLTADYLVSELLVGATPIDLIRPLTGPGRWSQQDYLNIVGELRETKKRDVSFGSLALTLSSADKRIETVATLLGLGFSDACDSKAVLDLAAEYSGLGGAVASGQLDALERKANHPDRNVASFAVLGIAGVYAEAIWDVWARQERSDKQLVMRELLGRLAVLGDLNLGILVSFFRMLLAITVEEREKCFLHVANDTYQLSSKSPAATLWKEVGKWASPPARLLAMDRGCIGVLTTISATSDKGLDSYQCAPFIVAADPVPTESLVFRPGGLLEALAVLSAKWEYKPLSDVFLDVRFKGEVPEKVDYESILQLGAKDLESTIPDSGDLIPEPNSDGVSWTVSVALKTGTMPVALPPAAVLLRLQDPTRLAIALAGSLGEDDGRIVSPLLQMASGDAGAYWEFAELAVNLPSRMFRTAPVVAKTWMHPGHPWGFPSGMDDLRALLSEPSQLGETLAGTIFDRVNDNGPWRERVDAVELLTRAASAPGSEALMMHWRLVGDRNEEEILESVARLEQSEWVPCVRLASDLLVATLAAASLKPENSEQIRNAANSALLVAIEGRDGLAKIEPMLLRASLQIVCASGGLKEAPRERIWMVWRLYDWLARQYLRMPEKRLIAALEPLASQAMEQPPTSDPFDPRRIDFERFDARLAVLLHPLAILKESAVQALVGPELKAKLQELAGRPMTKEEETIEVMQAGGDHWSWGTSPASVPRLAAAIVARLEIEPASQGADHDAPNKP